MQQQKRRSLVLTDETSKHPFLASLPPQVRGRARPVPMPRRAWFALDDVRNFLLAYCACFIAVSVYIA
jgi:hypothetical protein